MSIIWGFELDPSLNPLLNPELPMEFDTIHRIWTYFNCSLNYRQKQQKELNIRANDVLMMASVKLFNTNVKHIVLHANVLGMCWKRSDENY